MKDLWRIVIPMMRCWWVLIPLKMGVKYEDVQMVNRPERIAY
jgi:hypothetical protein